MDRQFSGREVIVTGASSGIGRAIALEMADCGANLWLTGRSQDELESTSKLAKELNPSIECHIVAMDIAEAGRMADLVAQASSDGRWLFALVNNAGVMFPEPITRGSRARWETMFDVNVLAPLEGCQAAIAAMRSDGRPGHLINISSVAARWEVGGVYGATKGAIETIGRSLREELENDDIRVTTILPGGFKTKLSRGFREEEIQTIVKNAASKGASGDEDRRVSDPVHIAKLVRFIFELPIDVNIQDVTIRPPIDIKV